MGPSPNLYRQEAKARGLDAHTVNRAVAIMAATKAAGAEPVFTLGHLSQLTGVSSRYLRQIIDRRTDPYVDITRPKAGGKTRAISSPEPLLKDAQRWILDNVLKACRIHDASYAYQRERSALLCARQHAGARWLVKLDLHNFFDQITERQVYRVVRGLGYPSLLAFEVARLCTRGEIEDGFHGRGPYASAKQGVLPQGAPTSGVLANAVAYPLDAQLAQIASKWGLVYTRYSDDLVFSTAEDFDRAKAWELIRDVDRSVAAAGLERHKTKTRIVPPGGRKIVLGLLLDHDRVFLPAVFKRRLETHVRGVAQHGLRGHAQHRHFDSVLSMVNHIDGLISYALSVEPEYATALRTRWETSLGAGQYPLGA